MYTCVWVCMVGGGWISLFREIVITAFSLILIIPLQVEPRRLSSPSKLREGPKYSFVLGIN